MPYQSNKDFSKSISNHLPEHAQTIFRKVFNSVYEDNRDEEHAFRAAWAAVKKQY